MNVITFIIFAYGLYVAVELARRVQLLCEKHTEANSRLSDSDYILFYFCTLSRLLLWYVLEWDKVGQSVARQTSEMIGQIQYPYIEKGNP